MVRHQSGVGGIERHDRDGAGRVDDVVEATEARDRVLDHLPALRLVGDVAREADGGAADLGGGLLAHLAAPRGQGHVGARGAEPLRDHPPDPRGRAHDQHRDALPADCHPSSPLRSRVSCSYHIATALIWRRGCASGQHDRHMVAIRSRLPRSILVLRHRDFALVQLGNGVSQLGTWGQYVALGWAIRELSGWPFAVSLSLVAQFLPFLLLSPVGGALADRLPRRRIVVLGNVLAVPSSIALGVLVATGEQTIPLLLLLAALGGIATALTQPAMSAVVGEIVPEDELPEAVASMSIINNLTRILGPSLAALVISGWGLQWAFYLNAASFFAVVVAWAFVRTVTRAHETHEPLRRQLALGLQFAAERSPDRLPVARDVRGHVRRVPRRARCR